MLGDGAVDPAVRLALFEVLEALLRPLVRACVRVPVFVCVCMSVCIYLVWWIHRTSNHKTLQQHKQLASFFLAQQHQQQQADASPAPHNLVESYLAFLLPVLLHCGLLESLTVRIPPHTHTSPHHPSTHYPPPPPQPTTQVFAIAAGQDDDPSKGRAAALLVDTVRALPQILPEPRWLGLVAMPALVRICEAAQATGAAAGGRGAVATEAQLLANRGADLMRRLCRAGLPVSVAAGPSVGGCGPCWSEVGAAGSGSSTSSRLYRLGSSPACPPPEAGGDIVVGPESLAGIYPGLSGPGTFLFAVEV